MSNLPVKVAQSVEIAHSELGASSAERWFNCPGSVAFLRRCPPAASSEYADEGTAAHQLASDYLEAYVNTLGGMFTWEAEKLESLLPANRVGEIIELKTKDGEVRAKVEVTDEMANAVQVYIDFCIGIITEHGLTREYVHVEKKVAIPGDDSHPDLFGTTDFAAVIPYLELHVIDYKHGAGKYVSPVNNKQGLYYALGTWLALPQDERDELIRIRLTIVQPRCWQAENDGINSYFIHRDALLEFEKELRAAVERTKEENAPLVPGDWCDNTFCAGRATCPALKEYVQTVARARFAEVAIEYSGLPKPETLTNDQLEYIMDNSAIIKGWLKAIDEEALGRAKNGGEFQKYKCVASYGQRKWLPEAEKELPEILGEKAYQKKLVTPAAADKILGKKEQDKIEHLWIKPETGVKLAPVESKAKGKSAVETFQGVTVDV